MRSEQPVPRARLPEVEIEYQVSGSGEPLLLICGLGGQLIDWAPEFVEMLTAHGFQVIRFDNRDSGLSTKFSDVRVSPSAFIRSALTARARVPYRIEHMARDAGNLLDHLGIDAAHVVGASMGGMIAQALAIREPDKVRSLTSVMSNTGSRRHGQPKPSLAVRLPLLGRMTRDNAVEKKLVILGAISGPAFDRHEAEPRVTQAVERCFDAAADRRQSLAILASPDRTPRLRRLRVPTLVVHGRRDPLVQPSGGLATARAIPGAEMLMVDDMGHDLPRHRWSELARAILHNAERPRTSNPALAAA